MASYYDRIATRSKGAWVVHHGQKTFGTVSGAAEFPALDAAGKAASLLSQLSASDQSSLPKTHVEALARAAGLNPKIELPMLLSLLKQRRVIDVAEDSGDVEVLGLTSAATVQHAAEIFEEQEPTREERAAVVAAEITSAAPVGQARLKELISDEFKLTQTRTDEFLARSESVGFIDAEGAGPDKLYFNGNLFRRESIVKTQRVLESLTDAEEGKVREVDSILSIKGCLSVSQAETILGSQLFDKLRAAGVYDINHVANASGEYGFVTRPAAFHKFNDPLVDDAFDLAKLLVAALYYGMTLSGAGRGRIGSISALLRNLIGGSAVGPATAIGEDYRVLETKRVIATSPGRSYGYYMRLLKKDVGEMALKVLTTGEAASTNAVDRPLPGSMTGYVGPERTRSEFRRKQVPASKRLTQDVLHALRTRGAL